MGVFSFTALKAKSRISLVSFETKCLTVFSLDSNAPPILTDCVTLEKPFNLYKLSFLICKYGNNVT